MRIVIGHYSFFVAMSSHLSKRSDWIRLVFSNPFPLISRAPVVSVKVIDLPDQQVGTNQSFSSQTLYIVILIQGYL